MNSINCVLIVDDNESSCDTLEALLAKQDYQLLRASDGYEALKQAITYLPDLILLDVMMPGMNGFETCKKIRQHTLLSDIPIILVTALDDRDSRIAGIESGADDFISKPYDKVELRTRVRSVLRLNRYRKLLGERLKFEWIAEHTREAFLLLTEDDVIRYANPQAQKYLELTEEQIETGEMCFLAVADNIFRREQKEWQHWLQDSENLQSSRYLVRPDNQAARELWLRVDALELPSGVPEDYLLRLTDASAEMNMRRKAWVFQDAVAHKLLTPLNGLQALTLLCQKQLPGLNEEQQGLLDTAKDSVHRLTSQVQGILNYMNRVPELISAPEKSSIKSFSPLMNRLQEYLLLSSRIRIDIQASLENKMFNINSELLELILRELLANAKKFHPQHTPKILIQLTLDQQHDNLVCCTVIDDGCHIPPEHLERLTQPYYQEEKYFTGEVEGMGLGLPMITSLLRGVGGYCHICNRADGKIGVEVSVGIPLAS